MDGLQKSEGATDTSGWFWPLTDKEQLSVIAREMLVIKCLIAEINDEA
jgi:hypothetical protein